jgi:hypothetical protein
MTLFVPIVAILLGITPPAEREPTACDEPAIVEGEVSKPVALSTPAPRLRPADLAGVDARSVWIEAVISCKGRVMNPSLDAELPERLEEIILRTVRRWRFKPARSEAGEAVAVVFKLAVDLVAT